MFPAGCCKERTTFSVAYRKSRGYQMSTDCLHAWREAPLEHITMRIASGASEIYSKSMGDRRKTYPTVLNFLMTEEDVVVEVADWITKQAQIRISRFLMTKEDVVVEVADWITKQAQIRSRDF
jgi:hypothetical protein